MMFYGCDGSVLAILVIASSAVVFSKSDLDLIIIDSGIDTEKPIHMPFIETVQGSNFSVTCKVVDPANNTDQYDPQIVWIRFRDKIAQATNHLRFDPVTLQHQDIYSCISLSYGLSKSFHLIVKSSSGDSGQDNRNLHKRFKRLNLLYFGRPSTNRDDNDRDLSYSEHESHPAHRGNNKGWIYTGVVVGAIAVIIIIGYLVYRLLKHLDPYSVAPESGQEPRPACNHPNCGQYCTFVETDRISVISSANHSVVDQCRPLSSHIPIPHTKNIERMKSESDLPPTYVNSVINSHYNDRYKLPPPYNEALKGDRQRSA